MDYFDLKGIIEAALEGLHVPNISFKPYDCDYLHPGKCASIYSGDVFLGMLGELHPAVRQKYDLLAAPILLLDLNLDKLEPLAERIYKVQSISPFPSIIEDIAVVVDETVAADEVLTVIKQAGGKMLKSAELFDIFRGAQLGAGKKSLAYNLVYQSPEKTLTDKDASAIRSKIIKRLEQVLNAKLRS